MRTWIAAAALAAAPAWAQDTAPVGVEACDKFIAAYQQCAATPGLLPAVKTSIEGAIPDLRNNFRTSAGRGAQARAGVAAQCLQIHDSLRQSLVQNFKCDFPASANGDSPAQAAAAAPAALPRRAEPARVDPEAAAIAKVNAYTEVQNRIVTFYPFAKRLADYQSNNERVLRLGTKLGADAWYSFSIGDFDSLAGELEKAIALPGAVPEVDGLAAKLLAALREVNPTVKALSRYQSTREFREDGFKFAREQHPVLVAGMKAAAGAADGFENALFDRGLARDERRMAALPEGSLPRQVLQASLSTRRAVKRYEALQPRGDTAPFLAALAEVSAANRELSLALDKLSPKASTYCTGYSRTLDAVLGHGRDLARDIRAGSNPRQPSERFGEYFNRSVEDYGRCLKDEERARS